MSSTKQRAPKTSPSTPSQQLVEDYYKGLSYPYSFQLMHYLHIAFYVCIHTGFGEISQFCLNTTYLYPQRHTQDFDVLVQPRATKVS